MKKPKEGGGKAASPDQTARKSAKGITFELFEPAARTVTLAGDFNGWDAVALPLRKDAGGRWKRTVRLAPGTYQYKFVVDGTRWVEDPLNLNRIANQLGGCNSMVEVAPQDASRRTRQGKPSV